MIFLIPVTKTKVFNNNKHLTIITNINSIIWSSSQLRTIQDETFCSTAGLATIDEGAKQEGSNAKVNCPSKHKSSNENEEICNTEENNNNGQQQNETEQNIHWRHSKDTIVQDQPSLTAVIQKSTSIISNIRRLPHNFPNIMLKALKSKKSTKDKAADIITESIGNDLTLFRSQQKEAIFNEQSYISFGALLSHEPTTSQKLINKFIKTDLNMERKSSASNFLLLPLHLVIQDDIAKSTSSIYVSALSQIYTYLLFCPDIANCPWVLDMLKKNWSGDNNGFLYENNKNVQCLVLLHSPTVINMHKLKEAIDKEDEDNEKDDDYNKDGFNGYDEYWSSIVVVTGCLFTIAASNNYLIWEHSFATDACYSQFLDVQPFLMNIAINGLSENMCIDTVNSDSITIFQPFIKQWNVVTGDNSNDVLIYTATIGPDSNSWDNSSVTTIISLLDRHYTESVKDKKQRIMKQSMTKNKFSQTMDEYIYANSEIIDVKFNNIDTLDEKDDKNTIICKTAERLSLNMAHVIELLYDKGKKAMKYFANSSYSVEDIASSQACIHFNCQKDGTGAYEELKYDSFGLSCTCCGSNIFTNDISSDMNDILKDLQDTMFCHFFKVKLTNINEYLFDQNFDHSRIKQCANVDHVKFLDALRENLSEESIKDMNKVHHSIYQHVNKEELHPFVKLMCTVLRNELKTEQTRNEIGLTYIYESESIQCILPSSKKCLLLDDATDKIQPGINHDSELMK
jgi:hypothetical protein